MSNVYVWLRYHSIFNSDVSVFSTIYPAVLITLSTYSPLLLLDITLESIYSTGVSVTSNLSEAIHCQIFLL